MAGFRGACSAPPKPVGSAMPTVGKSERAAPGNRCGFLYAERALRTRVKIRRKVYARLHLGCTSATVIGDNWEKSLYSLIRTP